MMMKFQSCCLLMMGLVAVTLAMNPPCAPDRNELRTLVRKMFEECVGKDHFTKMTAIMRTKLNVCHQESSMDHLMKSDMSSTMAMKNLVIPEEIRDRIGNFSCLLNSMEFIKDGKMDVPKTKEFFDMMFTIKEKKASFLEDVADCITMTQAAPASFISRSMHQLPIARMMGEGMLKISEFFRCIKPRMIMVCKTREDTLNLHKFVISALAPKLGEGEDVFEDMFSMGTNFDII